MTQVNSTPSRGRVTETLIELARCSKLHRIIVAGPKSPELMFELHRRGYNRVTTTTTCGLPQGQYHVALINWQGHSVKALETTLDWLVNFLEPSSVLVIRIEAPERGASRKLETVLGRLGFRVEVGTRCEHALAVSARRHDAAQMAVAA
jgi:hypothetical protein